MKTPLSIALICTSLFSSAIALANTTTQAQSSQPAQNALIGASGDAQLPEEDEQEAEYTLTSNGLKDLQEALTPESQPTKKHQASVSGAPSTNKEVVESEYPTFSSSERNVQLVAASLPEETVEEKEEASDEELSQEVKEHIEKVALRYQSIPTNPVYTYGKDANGQGACIGETAHCEQAELIWENFDEYVGNEELIVLLAKDSNEPDEHGQLIMPDEYKASVNNQPKVKQETDDLGGFTLYESGNQYKSGKHFGKLEGNIYYVKYAQAE